MKRRWMKSVIETSRQTTPALPFQRSVRRAARRADAAGQTPRLIRTA